MSVTKRRSRGGSLLGQGAYGCVFGPALACTHTSYEIKGTHTVGKVFSPNQKNELDEEARIARVVNDIDPNSEFTIKYYGVCDVDLKKVDMETVKSCEPVDMIKLIRESNKKKVPRLPQIIYENGGIDMHTFCTSYAVKNNIAFDDIIVMFLPIMKGLHAMSANHWVHFDIKPPNMLYNERNRRIYLIDFGLAQNTHSLSLASSNKLSEIKYVLAWPYMYYPPEFRIMAHILDMDKDAVLGVDRIYFSDLKRLSGYVDLLQTFGFREDDPGLRRLCDAASKKPAAFRDAFLQKYLYKADVFSLGMTLKEIIRSLIRNHAFHVVNTRFVNAFQRLLLKMIALDPKKRLSAEAAYTKLHDLVAQYKPDAPVHDAAKGTNTYKDKDQDQDQDQDKKHMKTKAKATCPKPRRPDGNGQCPAGYVQKLNKHDVPCCYKIKIKTS